ncbi:MAG: sigma-54-dependent Fis family transcriptional regulator [Blastocatellia bacterium]|nr:sigma-54-dependent Fis family transcriptional regulator [Blastocatellia bacterium]
MNNDTPHILVADDERAIRMTLEAGLSFNGFQVTAVSSGREAIEAASRKKFAAVVCDVFMPDGDGMQVIRELSVTSPNTPIILITAQGSIDLTVQGLSEGASDFIAKPFEIGALANLLRRYIAARAEIAETEEYETEASMLLDDLSRTQIVGRSPAMVAVYKLIAQAARTDATVLVTGESGTGKELVARAIHRFSSRSNKAFIAVNCSGLTDTLLEAELFGHVKGSFTGATSDRPGLFEAADGGTLFLDELASTSAAFQASLLRVLQSGEVRRVGSPASHIVDVRVIGASNASLRSMASDGNFRPDLFYRLSILSINLPPLRERADDLDLLTLHIFRRLNGEGQPPLRLTQEAAEALHAYSFPGNVRELENALTHAAALSSNGLVTLECLPDYIAEAAQAVREETPASGVHNIISDWPTMEELQYRYLQLVLGRNGGNRSRTASALGLDRRTVQRMLAKYQIPSSDDDNDEIDN